MACFPKDRFLDVDGLLPLLFGNSSTKAEGFSMVFSTFFSGHFRVCQRVTVEDSTTSALLFHQPICFNSYRGLEDAFFEA